MNYDIKGSAERIHQLRKKSELTQEQAAMALSITRSHYSRVESGASGCSVDLLIELSKLFDVSIDYIIMGQGTHNYHQAKHEAQIREDVDNLVDQLEAFKLRLEGKCAEYEHECV